MNKNKLSINNYIAMRRIGLIETSCFKSTLNLDRSWTFKSKFEFFVDSVHTYMNRK